VPDADEKPQHRVWNPEQGRQVPPGLCALAIMTKAPWAGAVKTRLQPPLTPEEAAELNVCFLRDTADAICRVRGQAGGVAVYTPPGAEEVYQPILPPSFSLIAQRGESFGERLSLAVEDLLRVGFESCCLIDSDSPTVPSAVFTEAVAALQTIRDCVVLGPSQDGGYYLIGMKKLHLRVFQGIDWSTEKVLAQTIERARETGLTTCLLPEGFDVDDRTTLRRLCDELLGHESDRAPATKAFLTNLIGREGRDRIWPR
jgi:rSAM/selenodomain-associated transferase 1